MVDFRQTAWQTPDRQFGRLQADTMADSRQAAWQISHRQHGRLQKYRMADASQIEYLHHTDIQTDKFRTDRVTAPYRLTA